MRYLALVLLAVLPAAGRAQLAPGPRTRAVITYGTVMDHFGRPAVGTVLTITGVDTSPDVPALERLRVGWMCQGARPVTARAVAGADGRFRAVLDFGEPARQLACLSIQAVPPAGAALDSIEVALDSVPVGARAAAGDSVPLDIMLPERSAERAAPELAPPAFAGADAELRWLAQTIPGGFGGFWRTAGSPELQVYLVDMARAPQAKAMLVRYFRLRPLAGGVPSDILFMRARWDAATLLGWRDRLRRLGPAGGVRAATLRPDWNRVQVTVTGSSGMARLRARLPALGIPEAALLLVRGG